MKTPGQIAYEANVAQTPNYPDGTARRTWEQLTSVARDSWERRPDFALFGANNTTRTGADGYLPALS